MIAAASSRPTSNGRSGCESSASKAETFFTPNKLPTTKFFLHNGKDFRLTHLTMWASGMPTIPTGSADDKQCSIFFRPIPGSMRITTAPHLNSAKTSATNSMPGGTISAIRSPLFTPASINPRAIRLVRASSSPKVISSYRIGVCGVDFLGPFFAAAATAIPPGIRAAVSVTTCPTLFT